MKDNFLISPYDENEEDDNNSIFPFNQNTLFQKEGSSFDYFRNIAILNEEEGQQEKNNDNEYNLNDFDNAFQPKKDENENYSKNDFPLMSPIPVNDDFSCKSMDNNHEMPKEDIFYKDGCSSGIVSDDAPLSTRGTGSKNISKEASFINSNINNNSKANNIFVSFVNEKVSSNNKKKDKTILSKKRKQRIHLEDLNLDPEIIKYKKYQTIGDKVITSKNSVITDLDKKEIRAIRNRISAQKSRDRKKAEFLNLQLQVKYLKETIEKQNLIIQHFQNFSCHDCKSKLNQIILGNNNTINIPLMEKEDQNDENEYLTLEENSSIFTEKRSSLFGKISGALITLVCLIGIVLCTIEGGFNLSYRNKIVQNSKESRINVRQLTSSDDDTFINENDNLTNINITDEEIDKIDLSVPLPIKSGRIRNIGNYLNKLQLYHDKFGLDIYSFLKKKRKVKNGFLMKEPFYNEKITDNSLCIDTKNIEHNTYIIDNNFNNTLPVEANNIVLDNNLSHRIISLFIKDYNILQRFLNGKSLSLEEQIEIEAKNSDDGCVYLQMIIPRYKIDDYGDNGTYAYENGFFEIRGKIFAYNNYYENKVTTSF